MSTVTAVFLLFFLTFRVSSGIREVRIGAVITNPNSRVGREQTLAIEMAVLDFNSSFAGLSLNSTHFSSQAQSLIDEWGATAIISTGPWPEVVQIAKFANKAQVPILSLSPSQPVIVVPKPFLFRMSHSAYGYIQCITALIKLYNWRQVVILYEEEDDYGTTSSSFIPLVNDAIHSIGSEINHYTAFPHYNSLSDHKALLNRELERLKKQLSTVFIIVRCSSPSLAIDLFKEADRLGMLGKGYVWITGDDITSLLDSTFTPSFISTYMQGVIGIKTYFNDSRKSYRNFSAKFQERFQEAYNEEGERSFEPGIYALQAYDAVHVIARSWDGVQSTNFIGLSGLIRFRSEGDLIQGKHSLAFRIVNVVGRSYKEMGIWFEGRGFYTEKRETGYGGSWVESLGPVYWPGGLEKVPGGWAKLKIGVPAMSMFVKAEYDVNGKLKDVTGFSIDVFRMALDLLEYYLPYDLIPFDNKTYSELVASVPQVFDAAVGDITILANRSKNVTFTAPFLPSALSRVVRLKPDRTPWMLTKPFTTAVWILLAATLLYSCFCIWYLEHGRNPKFDGPWWTQGAAALWLIFSSIFFDTGSLRSNYTKAMIMVWFFFVSILTSTFTASLNSILDSKRFEPVLQNGKVGCGRESFAVNYLQDVLGYRQDQIVKFDSIDDYASAFENGTILSAYLETATARVFLAKHDDYTLHGKALNLGGFGFAFPKNSALASDFSYAILRLSESGVLKQLEHRWFSLTFTTCPSPDTNRETNRLGLESFWFLFLFTGAASTIIVLLFKVRFFPSYGRRARASSMRLWKSKLRSLKMRQISRRRSLSKKQVAPEPECGDTPAVLEPHHHVDVDAHVDNGNFPN